MISAIFASLYRCTRLYITLVLELFVFSLAYRLRHFNEGHGRNSVKAGLWKGKKNARRHAAIKWPFFPFSNLLFAPCLRVFHWHFVIELKISSI